MAFAAAAAARRSLASRLSNHLARRPHPAFPHLLASHSSSGDPPSPSPLHPSPQFRSPHLPFPQSSRTALTLAQCPFGVHLPGLPPRRGFSSAPSFGAVLTDAAGAAASFPSEVAWTDSSLSAAAVQHLIDAVHSFTGLNWWLSIALSTVLLRSVLFPFSLIAMRRLVANNVKSEEEDRRSLLSLLIRPGLPTFFMTLTPYTLITVYFAISDMVEKVPSLKEGGAFWFTDLTTPDALHFFPVMTSLLLMLRAEFTMHYSRAYRDPKAKTARAVWRISYLLIAPLTANLPQAIGCYLVSWSFSSLTQSIVICQPAVKKLLFGDLKKRRCPSSDEPKKPTAEGSPCPNEEHEQPHPSEKQNDSDATVHEKPVPSEKRKASHASVHRGSVPPDKKSGNGI